MISLELLCWVIGRVGWPKRVIRWFITIPFAKLDRKVFFVIGSSV